MSMYFIWVERVCNDCHLDTLKHPFILVKSRVFSVVFLTQCYTSMLDF